MAQTSRRQFLRGSAVAAGGVGLAGPFQGLIAQAAMADEKIDPKNNRAGYGELVEAIDQTTGEKLLRLPKGFEYRTFGDEGSVMADGAITPPSHDGMKAFKYKGQIRLIRNHETQFQAGNAAGAPASGEVAPRAYDSVCNGGTTTLQIDAKGGKDGWGAVKDWRSASGTYFNCSGGNTTYRTWITCEELPGGKDLGGDFFGNGEDNLTKKHGYIYEVDSRWGPGENPVPTPIKAAGRFTHEGAVMDPKSGHLYMTQDDFFGPSGLYRYIPPNNAWQDRRIKDGGKLQMLRVKGIDNAELFLHQKPGARYNVDWVDIPDPDPTYAQGTEWLATLGTVSAQGIAKGAAQFSRLEGIRRRGPNMYFASTQGGQGREGVSSTFGPGYGQIWKLNLNKMRLSLVFEAPPTKPGPVGEGNLPALNLPDNLAISPRGALVLCEDGTRVAPPDFVVPSNFMRGLTRKGHLFDFAQNIVGDGEFTGATWAKSGGDLRLFFNIQTTSDDVGRTYEVRGPFEKGPF